VASDQGGGTRSTTPGQVASDQGEGQDPRQLKELWRQLVDLMK
jgi:hypothetical protein